MSKIENGYLIDQAKGRDPDAFAELMQLYMQDMYRVALAILMNDEDAADAIQDTILACWEKIKVIGNFGRHWNLWMKNTASS